MPVDWEYGDSTRNRAGFHPGQRLAVAEHRRQLIAEEQVDRIFHRGAEG